MEEFVTNSALLAGHLTKQVNKAIADQQAASADLQRAASDLGRGVAAAKQELGDTTRSAVRDALSREIPAAVEAIGETGDRLRQIADQLQREQLSAASRMRTLAWQSIGVMVIAAAVIIGGTAYAARSNLQRAEQAEVRAEVLEALQHVTITACDGTPCVKLADGDKRWSGNGEYLLIDTSTAPADAR